MRLFKSEVSKVCISVLTRPTIDLIIRLYEYKDYLMVHLEKMLKALADRTRLRIIGILLSHESCVCDMQEVLGLPQSMLSRHLAYLRSAGLISDRRVGRRIYCSMDLEGEVGKALRSFLESTFPNFGQFQEDNSRMKALLERGGWIKQVVAESGRSRSEDLAEHFSARRR